MNIKRNLQNGKAFLLIIKISFKLRKVSFWVLQLGKAFTRTVLSCRTGFWIRWQHMERRMELLHHCSKLIIGLWLLKVLNENCTLVKHPGLFTRIKTGYGEQCSNRETSVQGDILECMRWRLDCVVGLSSEYYTSELFHFASLRIK